MLFNSRRCIETKKSENNIIFLKVYVLFTCANISLECRSHAHAAQVEWLFVYVPHVSWLDERLSGTTSDPVWCVEFQPHLWLLGLNLKQIQFKSLQRSREDAQINHLKDQLYMRTWQIVDILQKLKVLQRVKRRQPITSHRSKIKCSQSRVQNQESCTEMGDAAQPFSPRVCFHASPSLSEVL